MAVQAFCRNLHAEMTSFHNAGPLFRAPGFRPAATAARSSWPPRWAHAGKPANRVALPANTTALLSGARPADAGACPPEGLHLKQAQHSRGACMHFELALRDS